MKDPGIRALVASQPQYVLVAQALIDDIQRGRYPVGSLLPPELDLCTHFGVSRHTMREAIRRLQERGLVTRQRGVGTAVRTDQVEARYVQSTASIADLPRYVEDTRLVTHASEDVIADDDLAELLGCPTGQRWLHVTGYRYAGRDKLPIALTHIYINAAYGGIQKLIGTQKVPVYTLIERQYGESVLEVRQTIRAVTMTSAEAQDLKVKRGSAGLVITRQYVGTNGRVLEVAVNLHPADRFSYSMSLRLQPPAGR
jgi:GntR family transcriptional regulator